MYLHRKQDTEFATKPSGVRCAEKRYVAFTGLYVGFYIVCRFCRSGDVPAIFVSSDSQNLQEKTITIDD